jgi:hypothetical protein
MAFLLIFLLAVPALSAAGDSAIVVLGCGMLEKKSTGRVISAIEACTNNTAYIIFAGKGIYNQTEADFLEDVYLKYNKKCLAIPVKEEQSYTTISNAFNTIKLFQKLNISRVTITTSADHFYAPFIFKAVSLIEDYPLEIKFVFSNYTEND